MYNETSINTLANHIVMDYSIGYTCAGIVSLYSSAFLSHYSGCKPQAMSYSGS